MECLSACTDPAASPSVGSGGASSNAGGAASGGASVSPGGNGVPATGAVGGLPSGNASGTGAVSGAAGSAGTPVFVSGGSNEGGTASGGSAGVGAPTTGGANAAGGGGTHTGGSADSGRGGGSSAGAAGVHAADHCIYGYDPQPTDAAMKDGPAEFYPPGNNDPSIVDTTLQPEVIAWMEQNSWQAAHVEWHAIRGCAVPGGGGLSKVNICSFTQLVPQDQNCQTAGDGYQFLLFHRHMIQALKQLWPKHTEQFTGFDKFPQSAADVPPQWRSAWKDWDANVLAAGKIGDEIDKPENLAKFPNEGVLGFWLQCNVGQKLTTPTNSMPFVGLHFVLHAKWARPGNTRHGVNNTDSNIDNYMFWKLHGWIDNVWEKYRLAKGQLPTDAKYKADLLAQCREMDTEINIIRDKLKPGDVVVPPPPDPNETGDFHTKVRPIFESQTNLCSGCHAETGANGKLTLGGNTSSKFIVSGLVNRPSIDGGQFKLVVPGDPDHSWLYLKASGNAAAAGCVASSTAQCIPGTMPPNATGVATVSAGELQVLRQWILDGARGP
ncbi:MAG TPA: hypothetical protein VG937_18545 [Polyangiaceae bacterium]|nr:hypothetical protein [Polyangiaceae bacterium]